MADDDLPTSDAAGNRPEPPTRGAPPPAAPEAGDRARAAATASPGGAQRAGAPAPDALTDLARDWDQRVRAARWGVGRARG